MVLEDGDLSDKSPLVLQDCGDANNSADDREKFVIETYHASKIHRLVSLKDKEWCIAYI